MAQCAADLCALRDRFECHGTAADHYFCAECSSNHATNKSLDICNRDCGLESRCECWCVAEYNLRQSGGVRYLVSGLLEQISALTNICRM